MKLIYSNENSILAGNIKNLLELKQIDVIVKNEFANGAVGDLSVFETWIELWVADERENVALEIVEQAVNNAKRSDWFCVNCKEANGANFEVCWQCGHEQ